MKEKYNELLEKINGNRTKLYFKLKELETITGLCSRSLKYRMKKVKEKYSNIPSLLTKKGRDWQIHYTLIDDFMPKYNKSQTNIFNHKWETFVTWNMKNNYEVKYHIELIGQIKKKLPSANIAYVIEQDGRGYNHIHAIVDDNKDEVENVVSNVLRTYLDKSDFRTQIEKINNKGSITNYILKSGEITII